MGRWPTAKLAEVLSLDLDRVKIDPTATYEMVGVYSFGRGLFLREPVHGGNTSYKYFYHLQADHIVMSQLFGWEGALALSSKEFAGKYVSPQFPTFKTSAERLDRSFLGWYMRRRQFWEELGSRTRGMGDRRRTLNPDALLDCTIPLPPLSEQRRIVAKIDQVAAKIEEVFKLKKAVTDLSEKMLAGVFHRIVDKAPYLPMENVAPLVRRPVDVQPNAVYLELGVRSFGKGTFHKPALPGSEVGTKKLYRIETGDIVLSNVFAWEGGIAVAKKEDTGRVGSHRFITRVPVSTKATANFIKYYLLTPEGLEKIGEASPGGAGRNRTLGLKKLDTIEVPIPSMEKQCYFDRLVNKVETLKAFHGITVSQLNAVVPKVLDVAFAGPG